MVTIEIDKKGLARVQTMLREHPFNDPKDVTLKACKKLAPEVAKDVRRAAPRRSGALRSSVKPIARKSEKGDRDIEIGVRMKKYWVFVQHRTGFLDTILRGSVILPKLVQMIKRGDYE